MWSAPLHSTSANFFFTKEQHPLPVAALFFKTALHFTSSMHLRASFSEPRGWIQANLTSPQGRLKRSMYEQKKRDVNLTRMSTMPYICCEEVNKTYEAPAQCSQVCVSKHTKICLNKSVAGLVSLKWYGYFTIALSRMFSKSTVDTWYTRI